MRNVQGSFATWYNRTFGRKGHFWGDRFKSALLGGPESVLNSALYVELNAVRAGLVECPEDYEGGTLYLCEAGQDKWLLPLSEILHEEKLNAKELHTRFKQLCYFRGSVITKQGQKAIPEEVAQPSLGLTGCCDPFPKVAAQFRAATLGFVAQSLRDGGENQEDGLLSLKPHCVVQGLFQQALKRWANLVLVPTGPSSQLPQKQATRDGNRTPFAASK